MSDPNESQHDDGRPSLIEELPRALASIAVSMASIVAATLVFVYVPGAEGPTPWLALALAGLVFAALATTGGLMLLSAPSRASRRRILSRVLILASLVLLAANDVEAGARLLGLAVVAGTSFAIIALAERQADR